MASKDEITKSDIYHVDESGVPVDKAVTAWGLSGGDGGAFADTNGDGVAELQENHADFQGGDARNVGSINTESVNNIVYASENDASLPSLQTAETNATDGDTLVVVPGDHTVGSTWTLNPRLNLVIYGTIKPSGDFPVIEANAICNWWCGGRAVPTVDCQGVSHTSNGIVYHQRQHIFGLSFVWAAGNHGHYFHQSATGENLNNSIATLKADDCGGDGIRVDNTTTNADDCNAMQIRVERASGCAGAGYRQNAGFGNFVVGLVESNNNGVVLDGQADRNQLLIIDSEANTTNGLLITGNASGNFVRGYIQDGVTDNSGAYNLVNSAPAQGRTRIIDQDDGLRTAAPATAADGDIHVWEEDGAAAPIGRITVQINGTAYTFNADS